METAVARAKQAIGYLSGTPFVAGQTLSRIGPAIIHGRSTRRPVPVHNTQVEKSAATTRPAAFNHHSAEIAAVSVAGCDSDAVL